VPLDIHHADGDILSCLVIDGSGSNVHAPSATGWNTRRQRWRCSPPSATPTPSSTHAPARGFGERRSTGGCGQRIDAWAAYRRDSPRVHRFTCQHPNRTSSLSLGQTVAGRDRRTAPAVQRHSTTRRPLQRGRRGHRPNGNTLNSSSRVVTAKSSGGTVTGTTLEARRAKARLDPSTPRLSAPVGVVHNCGVKLC
jgi:hypothetical protein